MDEIESVILGLMSGARLAAVYLGSLWWTAQKGVSLKRPAPLFVGRRLAAIRFLAEELTNVPT